jgi:branched-chain amino acid transport system permease protein
VVLLKNVASAYIDRWIMLLGLVFIFIVMFVPGGIVAGIGRLRGRRVPAAAPTEAAPAAEVVR